MSIVGIYVFFTVNSFVAHAVSGGSIPIYMIPVMILLPIGTGLLSGIPAGMLLKKKHGRKESLWILLAGITITVKSAFCSTVTYLQRLR